MPDGTMSGEYKVQFNKKYLKDLQKVPQRDQTQIRSRILALADNPRPEGSKKFSNTKDTLYRIRSGDYRIIYTVKDDILLILVIEIAHRKDVYRML